MPDETGTKASKSHDFSALIGLGKFICFLGWLVAAVFFAPFVAGVGYLFKGDSWGWVGVGAGVLGVLFGLLCVAFGEVFECFVSTERGVKDTVSEMKANNLMLSEMSGTFAEIRDVLNRKQE